MVNKELLLGMLAYAIGVFGALHVMGLWRAAGPNANGWGYGAAMCGVGFAPLVLLALGLWVHGRVRAPRPARPCSATPPAGSPRSAVSAGTATAGRSGRSRRPTSCCAPDDPGLTVGATYFGAPVQEGD